MLGSQVSSIGSRHRVTSSGHLWGPEGKRLPMRLRLAVATVLVLALPACDLGKITVGTTAKILVRGQPALSQESDYQLAHDAIPGTLKTVEAFWVVDPDNEELLALLTEGYCQYGTAFVEDDWEVAKFAKKLDDIEYHNAR